MTHPKLSVKRDFRKRLIANLATSALLYGKITTTVVKAKMVKSYLDRIIGRLGRNDLATRRYIGIKLSDKKAVAKLFDLALQNVSNLSGSVVSVHRIGTREGDGVMQAELLINPDIFKSKPVNKKEKSSSGTDISKDNDGKTKTVNN